MKTKNFSIEKRGKTHMQWIFAMIANLTMLVYGLLSGWVSPVTKLLQSKVSPLGYPLSDSEISWIASVFPLAGIFTATSFMFVMDRYGRKLVLLLVSVAQTICCVITIFARNGLTIVIARVFAGVAAAGCYSCVYIYVKEISDDRIRGTLCALFTLYQNVGYLIIYAMGAYLDYYLVLYIMTTVSVITGLSLILVPESPPFLIGVGKYDQAAKTIANIRNLDVQDKPVQDEIEVMTAKANEFKSLPKIHFFTLFKNSTMRRGILYMWVLLSASCSGGNFAIVSYASVILRESGVVLSPELQAMSIPTVMIIGSLSAVVFIEKIGRKIILLSTFMVSAVALALLGSIILIQQRGGAIPEWFPMLCIISFEFAYAAGNSSMPYIMVSEMFRFEIRARMNGFFGTNGWTLSFLTLIVYHPLSNAFGTYTTFYIYAAINFAGMIVALFFVPETRGKSVEAIHDELRRNIFILPTRKYYRTAKT